MHEAACNIADQEDAAQTVEDEAETVEDEDGRFPLLPLRQEKEHEQKHDRCTSLRAEAGRDTSSV